MTKAPKKVRPQRRRSRTRRRSTRLRSIRWSVCAAETLSMPRKPCSKRRSASRKSPSSNGSRSWANSERSSPGKARAPRSRATNGSTIPPGKPARLHQRLLQSYLAWGDAINAFVDKVDLNDQDRARAKLISQHSRRRAGADERHAVQSGRAEEAGRYRRSRASGRDCKTTSTTSSRTAACRRKSTPSHSRSARTSPPPRAPSCFATRSSSSSNISR